MGDYTSNNFFYLPEYGASGEDELETFNTALESTDGAIKSLQDNLAALEVTDAEVVFSDVTTNNVSAAKHGYCPKHPNDATKALLGDGTWGTATATTAAEGAVVGKSKDLVITVTSATALTLTATEVALETAGNLYKTVRSVSLNIAITTAGANGLDAGAEAPSTWYAVFVIYNGTTLAGLLSASATSPTLPAGYTYFARVGWVYNDAGSNLRRLIQKGGIAQYTNTGTGLPVICSGAQGSIAVPTWVAIAWATWAPSTAKAILLALKVDNACIMVGPNNQGDAYDSLTNFSPLVCNSANPLGIFGRIVMESSNIYVAATADSALACLGWEE